MAERKKRDNVTSMEVIAHKLIENNEREHNFPIEFEFKGEPISMETMSSATGFLPVIFHVMSSIDRVVNRGRDTWMDGHFKMEQDPEAILGVKLCTGDKDPKDLILANVQLLCSGSINEFILNPDKNQGITLSERDGQQVRTVHVDTMLVQIDQLSQSSGHMTFGIDSRFGQEVTKQPENTQG